MTERRQDCWRIFILEDQPLVSRAFAAAVGRWRKDTEIAVASDVMTADRILRNAFDVAVLDVFVPGDAATPAGGLRVLERLVADRSAPLRVVVSGIAKAAEWAQVGRLVVQEVLEKPCTMTDLHAALDRELDRLLHARIEAPQSAGADEIAAHAKRLAVRDKLTGAGSIEGAARALGWSWQKLSYNIRALGLHELPNDAGTRRRWI